MLSGLGTHCAAGWPPGKSPAGPLESCCDAGSQLGTPTAARSPPRRLSGGPDANEIHQKNGLESQILSKYIQMTTNINKTSLPKWLRPLARLLRASGLLALLASGVLVGLKKGLCGRSCLLSTLDCSSWVKTSSHQGFRSSTKPHLEVHVWLRRLRRLHRLVVRCGGRRRGCGRRGFRRQRRQLLLGGAQGGLNGLGASFDALSSPFGALRR